MQQATSKIERSLCPPPYGGHIVFSADPVGVRVSVCVRVCVSSFLHSISLMNRWILIRFIIEWGKNAEYILMTLIPFSRSHEDINYWKMLVNCLSAPYLLKEQIDFDNTCTSRLLGHVKELIGFW